MKLALPLIAILAILALATPKPSLSAIFIFCESILIALHLAIADGLRSTFFHTSILLSFFSMIMVGSNFYFEISYKKTITKLSKFNLIMGSLLLSIIWAHINKFSFSRLSDIPSTQFFSEIDGFTLVTSGFALFAMLVSALTIFDMKSSKPGNSI
jgi:hypothetical protein